MEDKKRAISYYLEHGRNMARTIKAIGYPHRETMREWVYELVPNERKVYSKHSVMVKYTSEQEKEAVIEFSAGDNTAVSRRIHAQVKSNCYIVSKKVIRRIMKEERRLVPLKRRRVYGFYKGEISPAVENLIARDFHADAPNKKWLTDLTEFHVPAGKVYLSPIIDCFDGNQS